MVLRESLTGDKDKARVSSCVLILPGIHIRVLLGERKAAVSPLI